MKCIKSLAVIAFLLLGFVCSFAQNQNIRYEQNDPEIFYNVITHVRNSSHLPMNELVTEIALHLLGTPYVAATLEHESEMRSINLRETDCILFVEMCTALAITAKQEHPSFDDYCNHIRNFRYRNGVVDGYASRIHYTSEWIIQNSNRGYMNEFSSDLGKPLDQTFSYMSTHSDSYKQLENCPDMVSQIANVEKQLNGKGPYYYIPQDMIKENETQIRNGDIICFRSNVEGLDIAHVAFAYWDNGELKFIHASFKEKKVVIDRQTIADYAKNGIRVVRLN
jgi:hypothetical protein